MENSRAELITLADKRHSPPKVSPCPRPILLILSILSILSSLFLPLTIARHITTNQVRVSPIRVRRI